MAGNYYVSSIFWSTLSKILTAAVGFVSVPLLLGYYGKADYGLLAIATACNGYMHLLDLGMNVGAVKFFSQWKAEGDIDRIYRVAASNITFYLTIAVVNILLLVCVAEFGRGLFSITDAQFVQLRTCLYVIAAFCAASWVTTVFNQLLVSDTQMPFTMQVQCAVAVLKGVLVVLALLCKMSLTSYFCLLTAAVAVSIFPYAIRCKQLGLITSFRPSWFWKDFKVVLWFSLSIFALSLFQMTATQSRPIILSMFCANGAGAVADFRIMEVVPSLIAAVSGTFSGVFLPKTSEMVARGDSRALHDFAYHWTNYTSAFVCMLCFPFILCASETLSAYVGTEYAGLSIWLTLWCLTMLVQMHTTPGNALVLAYGKTRLLVIVTAVTCCVSIIVNILLCRFFDAGSAVISYALYTSTIIGLYYVVFYKKLLGLRRLKIFICFAKPTLVATIFYVVVSLVWPYIEPLYSGPKDRLYYIGVCIVKSCLWLAPYLLVLNAAKIVDVKRMIIRRGNL